MIFNDESNPKFIYHFAFDARARCSSSIEFVGHGLWLQWTVFTKLRISFSVYFLVLDGCRHANHQANAVLLLTLAVGYFVVR